MTQNSADIPEQWLGNETPIDFIVVGAGAAGCPLAARLAERGYCVVVIDMGPKQVDRASHQIVDPVEVPLLHAEATEDPRYALHYFVKQRDDEPGQAPAPAVFYPRAQGVGGCANHNAMITFCGPNEDWDEIAELTGDSSWNSMAMRSYFERIEDCAYSEPRSWWERLTAKLFGRSGWEGCRHGTSGWLTTTLPDMHFLKQDKAMLRTVLKAASATWRTGIDQLSDWLKFSTAGRARAVLDPNHWHNIQRQRAGITQIPCSIDRRGARSSPRQRLLDAQSQCSDRLHILSHVLVTRVELSGNQAIGVRVIPRAHAYQADPNYQPVESDTESISQVIRCRGEVILSAGAFNSPQLLMLSGIGDEALCDQTTGIKINHPLSGVGHNLQDRYEVAVQATLAQPFHSLQGITLTSHSDYSSNDVALQEYLRSIARSTAAGAGSKASSPGIYSSNGALVGMLFRSQEEDQIADIFIMAVAGQFSGYRVGWSSPASLIPGLATLAPGEPVQHRTISWLILKARTKNCAGYVRLLSSDPTQRPEINFRSFSDCQVHKRTDESSSALADVRAIKEGVHFVANILNAGIERGDITEIHYPGKQADQSLEEWIRQTAWGHHACGTCRMGRANDPLAVVDSRFRVRGLENLRVVDASVFPRIPGYFIATNIYMLAEKAADVLTEDHPRSDAQLVAATAEAGAPVIPSSTAHQQRQVFPSQLEAQEAALIRQRRKAAGQ